MQIGSGQLDSRGVCQCAAVEAVKGMGREKGVEETRTSDVADEYDLVFLEVHPLKGFVKGAGHDFVGTAGAICRGPGAIDETGHA
jgi:hypothetical protein